MKNVTRVKREYKGQFWRAWSLEEGVNGVQRMEWSDIIRTEGKHYNFSIMEYGKTWSLGKRHCSCQGRSCPMAQLILNSDMRVCFHNFVTKLIHIQKILIYSSSASMYPLLDNITTFMLSFKLLFHTSNWPVCYSKMKIGPTL